MFRGHAPVGGDRRDPHAQPWGGGPAFTWQPALGRIGSPHPKVSAVTAGWRRLADCLQRIADGIRPGTSEGAARRVEQQWWNLVRTKWGGQQRCAHSRAQATWVAGIRLERLHEGPYVAALVQAALRNADATEAHDRRRAQTAWQHWLTQGPAKSLGRHHRMSRVAGGWIPSTPDAQSGGNAHLDDDGDDGPLATMRSWKP